MLRLSSEANVATARKKRERERGIAVRPAFIAKASAHEIGVVQLSTTPIGHRKVATLKLSRCYVNQKANLKACVN